MSARLTLSHYLWLTVDAWAGVANLEHVCFHALITVLFAAFDLIATTLRHHNPYHRLVRQSYALGKIFFSTSFRSFVGLAENDHFEMNRFFDPVNSQ